MFRRSLNVFILCISIIYTPILASLYPTKPTASTLFIAGQPAQLKWVEDGRAPLLKDVGPVKIDLYAGNNNTLLATLAQNINPMDMSTTVYIPANLPANYHSYTLRFVPAHRSNSPSFTSTFTIASNALAHVMPPSQAPEGLSHPGASFVSGSGLPSAFGTPTQSQAALSRITGTAPAPDGVPNATPSGGRYVPLEDGASGRFGFGFGFNLLGGMNGRQHGFGKSLPNIRRERPEMVLSSWRDDSDAERMSGLELRKALSLSSLDVEKMKFRLVFIVWPAMVGLSLAM